MLLDEEIDVLADVLRMLEPGVNATASFTKKLSWGGRNEDCVEYQLYIAAHDSRKGVLAYGDTPAEVLINFLNEWQNALKEAADAIVHSKEKSHE